MNGFSVGKWTHHAAESERRNAVDDESDDGRQIRSVSCLAAVRKQKERITAA